MKRSPNRLTDAELYPKLVTIADDLHGDDKLGLLPFRSLVEQLSQLETLGALEGGSAERQLALGEWRAERAQRLNDAILAYL